MLVRALLISSLYNVSSFRRLCAAISGNLAFRWFCFLTIDIDDEVFNHSTISYFIERVGNEGFGEIFQRFNVKDGAKTCHRGVVALRFRPC